MFGVGNMFDEVFGLRGLWWGLDLKPETLNTPDLKAKSANPKS